MLRGSQVAWDSHINLPVSQRSLDYFINLRNCALDVRSLSHVSPHISHLYTAATTFLVTLGFRSLSLDALSDSELMMISRRGNDKINEILEAELQTQPGWKKPTAESSREERSTFIKSKYEFLGFVRLDNSKDESALSNILEKAVEDDDLIAAHEALIKGAKLRQGSSICHEEMKTLLNYYNLNRQGV